ncbi:MAG: hypothetical protein RMK29_11255 [Myxococcales bacterium]|nr:hypothetical protein [Myxococcota bacterium]MDW8282284.1 hypothetical protein [Myxococcales bacterium]
MIDPIYAVSLKILADEIRELAVEVLEDQPPQFVLRGVRTMPTPGWKLCVDRVDKDIDASGMRLGAYLTDIPPKGIVPQVLSPTEVRIPLGPLPLGRHLVSIFSRREEEATYRLLHALVVEAERPSAT